MRVLVTGGTGLVGSHLARRLQEMGHAVVITGHDAEPKPEGFAGLYLQPSFIGLDWEAIGAVDAVFHQAAINDTTLLNAQEMWRANVESSRELFQRTIEQGCRRIVYASSTAVYGDGGVPYREDQELRPLNPYAESKVALEKVAADLNRAHPDAVFVGLRYSNVYGPGEAHKGRRASMIYQLAQQMRDGNPRIFKNGEQQRDYISVGDVVEANLKALRASSSVVVNCGSGTATTFNDLIAILNDVMGMRRMPEYIHNPYTDRYQSHTECDMSLAKERLGFVPNCGIEEGIRAYHATDRLLA